MGVFAAWRGHTTTPRREGIPTHYEQRSRLCIHSTGISVTGHITSKLWLFPGGHRAGISRLCGPSPKLSCTMCVNAPFMGAWDCSHHAVAGRVFAFGAAAECLFHGGKGVCGP